MMKTGLLFPGQGSQSAGMGEDLYKNLTTARTLLDSACDLLGYDIRNLIFEGLPEDLRKTENAQVSIFLVSMMSFEKWKTMNRAFHIVAGHSLGEYSALCAAKVLTFEDALRLVSVRGKLMADCCSDLQGMLAVLGVPLEQIYELIDRNHINAEVANINSSRQIVLSGLKTELLKVKEMLYNIEDGSARWLNVAGAFHSGFMTPAKLLLKQEMDKITFRESVCPIVSNLTGKETMNPEEIRLNLLGQTDSCVRWLDTILRMKELEVSELFEIGPGEVLKKLNATITFKPRCHSI